MQTLISPLSFHSPAASPSSVASILRGQMGGAI